MLSVLIRGDRGNLLFFSLYFWLSLFLGCDLLNRSNLCRSSLLGRGRIINLFNHFLFSRRLLRNVICRGIFSNLGSRLFTGLSCLLSNYFSADLFLYFINGCVSCLCWNFFAFDILYLFYRSLFNSSFSGLFQDGCIVNCCFSYLLNASSAIYTGLSNGISNFLNNLDRLSRFVDSFLDNFLSANICWDILCGRIH